ncbi:MAG: ATP-binding protein [Simkaniaceae bacterium]|nr:ATP-binding protein [Candidatus Sacchlamyda saccharinae]
MKQRNIFDKLVSILGFMPVLLISGARQTGKTTLTKLLTEKNGYEYYSFDDSLTLANASKDPAGWIQSITKPVVIDEVQRIPEIFLSIKYDVDKNRNPGRYILTGSAYPLLLPRLGDSLAGRMGIAKLYPFSQGEIRGKKEQFIDSIFSSSFSARSFNPISSDEYFDLLCKGGFPTISTSSSYEDIDVWLTAYLQTMLERDVRDIANIEGIRDFPRLYNLLAARSSTLLNMAEVSRSIGMPSATVSRYIRLLEVLFFIFLVPSWHSNRGKRIVKAPKLHLCDTAILTQLLNASPKQLQNDPSLCGKILETFIFNELQKQQSWSSTKFNIFHFRDGDKEVDFVLEKSDGTIIGIEVKNARSPIGNASKGLHYLKSIAKEKFFRGIVLHLGEQIQCVDDIWYVPIQALWEL